jgi:oligopeptide transport system substrate-binding protein
MRKKQYLKLGILVMGTMLLASCGNQETTKEKTTKNKDTSTESRTINLMEQTEIGSLDTIFTQEQME